MLITNVCFGTTQKVSYVPVDDRAGKVCAAIQDTSKWKNTFLSILFETETTVLECKVSAECFFFCC